MRTLLVPIAAFALMGANEEAEVSSAQPSNNTLVIEQLRERLEQHRLEREYEKKLGITRKSALVDLLRNPVTGSGLRCQDQLERAQVEGDANPSLVEIPGPLLRRGPNTADKPPLAIYAVDQREGGCGVMVMMGDPTDVRPVPAMGADDHRLMPAGSDPED